MQPSVVCFNSSCKGGYGRVKYGFGLFRLAGFSLEISGKMRHSKLSYVVYRKVCTVILRCTKNSQNNRNEWNTHANQSVTDLQ